MYIDEKISIYKNIIHYLLLTTACTLGQIANLSNSPVQDLRTIYHEGLLPENSKAGINLLKLFTVVVDMELKGKLKASSSPLR